MNFIMRFALMLLLPCFFCGSDFAQAQDRSFEFENYYEQVQKNRCFVNRYRGPDCSTLMGKLCQRIEFKNTECKRWQLNGCYETNGYDPKEARCDNTPMAGPCYGNNASCGVLEKEVCALGKFEDRFCDWYRWSACKEDNFESLACRKYHNKMVVDDLENRLSRRISWGARGQRQSVASREGLTKAKEGLEKALSNAPDAEKRAQIAAQLADVSKLLQETEFLCVMCDIYGPFRPQTEVPQ
jgi:hypothetical protein